MTTFFVGTKVPFSPLLNLVIVMNENGQPTPQPRSLALELAILLDAFNPQLGNAWRSLYAEPADHSEAIQICWINRFWRDQLTFLEMSSTGIDTRGARECLIDQITFNDWLRLFQAHVIPFVLTHSLPRQRQIAPQPGEKPHWADIANWSPQYGG